MYLATPPTDKEQDKPGTVFRPPSDRGLIDHENVIKVPDCRAVFETLRCRGEEVLEPPLTSARPATVRNG